MLVIRRCSFAERRLVPCSLWMFPGHPRYAKALGSWSPGTRGSTQRRVLLDWLFLGEMGLDMDAGAHLELAGRRSVWRDRHWGEHGSACRIQGTCWWHLNRVTWGTGPSPGEGAPLTAQGCLGERVCPAWGGDSRLPPVLKGDGAWARLLRGKDGLGDGLGRSRGSTKHTAHYGRPCGVQEGAGRSVLGLDGLHSRL